MDNCLRRSHREWLSDLTIAGEPECMSILYAESLLGPSELFSQCGNGTQRIFMGTRYPMKSIGSVCEAPVKPQRCIARMTSLGCNDVMTASTPVENLRQKIGHSAIKFGHPRTGCPQRPVSALMSDEMVLRAQRLAVNRRTTDYVRLQRRNNNATTAVVHFSATLPTRRSACRSNHGLMQSDCSTSSSYHSSCCESKGLPHLNKACSTVIVNSPHQRENLNSNSRQLISRYDLSSCQSTASLFNASSNHNNDVFTENLSHQRTCTCRLGSPSQVGLTGSILNIAVSGETASPVTISPSVYLSNGSELARSYVPNTSRHDRLEGDDRSENNDAGLCNSLSLPTHKCIDIRRCANEGDVHCAKYISMNDTNHASNDYIERISEEDSESYQTLCADTFFFSEGNKRKGTKDHSNRMRNSEQFGSTVTIRVASPMSSREDAISSDAQCRGISNRAPVRGESSSLKADASLSCRRVPPSYSQLRVIQEGDRTTSRVMLGQSPLFVSEAPEETAVFANTPRSRCRMASCGPTTSTTASSTSPKSLDSGSNSSVDSGQGSGGLSSQSHSSKDFSEGGASYARYARNNLPSYVRVASIMDHVLRTSSAMNSLLSSTRDASMSKELITKANMFIHIIEVSPCARFLPMQDITVVKELMSDLQSKPSCTNRLIFTSNYLAFMLRKLLEEVLMIFAKIISRYLSDCINKDRLLVIALEHLIHLMLFGDDVCLEIIQSGGLNAISTFIRMPTTPNDTLRLLLRTLAILCRLPKGAMKLLSLGGLDMTVHILCTCSVACAVEAAGVLAQLTNPMHALIKLNASSTYIIARLLDVVDECRTAESLLLCAAAVANVSAQHRALVDNLYQYNATARLIAALKRPGCDTVFVHEQLAVIFSRLAAEGYEEALIAQGALPILLSMLTLSDLTHVEYCHRIRYKAAVCLATIASKGVGLKALYQNNGYAMISKAIKKEQVSSTPTAVICTGIKEKLERKYQMESAV